MTRTAVEPGRTRGQTRTVRVDERRPTRAGRVTARRGPPRRGPRGVARGVDR